jgi:hypothetical protein
MTRDTDDLWPHDPEALDDNRTVDDLEIPDLEDEEVDLDDTEEWGDDADNRPVELDDDDDTDLDDLER